MKRFIEHVSQIYSRGCSLIYLGSRSFGERHAKPLCYLGGIFLMLSGASAAGSAFAQVTVSGPDTHIIAGLCRVLYLVEGSYGALVMGVAGLVAIISAAMGAYKTAMNILVVGIGAMLLRPMIALFFQSDFGCTFGSPLGSHEPV